MNFSSRYLFLILILAVSCKSTQQPVQVTSRQPAEVGEKRDSVDLPLAEAEVSVISDTIIVASIPETLRDTFTLVAVGDIMVGTNYPNASYLPAQNGSYLWDHSRSYFLSADIAFGNLEGTVLNGAGEPKECKNPDACYLFRMPSRLARNFQECGFDLVSIANNHANDFGPVGRRSTQRVLDSLGITHAGSVENPFTITNIRDLKVGFVAFAPNKGTLTFYDLEIAAQIVRKLADSSDVVIVSIHGGAEGPENQHVTRQREFYFGEDRGNIYDFSHAMIDAGADIILGHGPHVSRAIEVYKNRLIAYSLGNFCTYGRFNLRGAAGIAPMLNVRISRTGEFYDGSIVSFRQSYENGPQLDHSMTAAKTIRQLSLEDFPESQVSIDEEGRISYIQN